MQAVVERFWEEVVWQCDIMIELLLPEKFLYNQVAPSKTEWGVYLARRDKALKRSKLPNGGPLAVFDATLCATPRT
jgi:hypothetical protein